MRRSEARCIFLLFVLSWPTVVFGEIRTPQKLYYGFEMNGQLVGYMEVDISPGDLEKKSETEVSLRLFAKLTLLGQNFDIKVLERFHADPQTGQVSYYDSDIEQGAMKMGSTVVIEGHQARFTSKMGGKPKVVTMSPDVIFESPLDLRHVITDLAEGKAEKKSYRVLDNVDGEIHEVTYTRLRAEEMNLAGEDYRALVFDRIDLKTGVGMKLWLDRENGRFIRMEVPNGAVVCRADPAVVGKVKRAEIDDILIARVDVPIADYHSISYMKVKATIRSMGEWVTPASLNVPGQRFTGTVEDNLVDGIFEIEHKRYDGGDAPPFPPDFSGDKALKEYLEPENLIESDDPVLVKKAQELTAGAKDSWDAAGRLSKWVAEEIGYEIPGGSARQTFDSGKGECGSHSRLLTALCRAVGIPARLACGCMFTPLYGGSFGQHAWNEIYMGPAGWISVDSTAREIDYVDSGHIRLGSETSFNPEKMEVLDYKAGSLRKGDVPAGLGSFAKVPWEAGKTYSYTYALNGVDLGTDSFTIKDFKQQDGKRVYTCATKLELTGRTTSGEWKLDDQGCPLAYELTGKAGDVDYTINCEFFEDKVVEKATQAGQPVERTVPLTEKVYLVDNNNISLFAFLMAAAPREQGRTAVFRIFHPTSMQVLTAQVTAKGCEPVTVGGQEREGFAFDVALAGTVIKMWVDQDGRLLKDVEASGRMVVELKPDQED